MKIHSPGKIQFQSISAVGPVPKRRAQGRGEGGAHSLAGLKIDIGIGGHDQGYHIRGKAESNTAHSHLAVMQEHWRHWLMKRQLHFQMLCIIQLQ